MLGPLPVDPALALDGYLRMGKRCCYVPGVEELMRETLKQGATVIWETPFRGGDGCVYHWSRVVVLNPRLFLRSEWTRLKIAWGHEIGHLAMGRSHAKATRYQLRHFDFNSLDI